MRIKNWEKFQQYKDGRPIHWIKLHLSLLDDCRFDDLDEITQLHLIKLWIFAAKNNGEIDGSEKFIARRIGAKKIDFDALVQGGWVIRTESYETVPREEKRREEESREDIGEKSPVIDFDEFWQAYPKKVAMEAAEKAWKRVSKKDRRLAIADCKTRYQGTQKQFMPNPATYLNGKRWLDERISDETRGTTGNQQTADYHAYQAKQIADALGGGAVCETDGDLRHEVDEAISDEGGGRRGSKRMGAGPGWPYH